MNPPCLCAYWGGSYLKVSDEKFGKRHVHLERYETAVLDGTRLYQLNGFV